MNAPKKGATIPMTPDMFQAEVNGKVEKIRVIPTYNAKDGRKVEAKDGQSMC